MKLSITKLLACKKSTISSKIQNSLPLLGSGVRILKNQSSFFPPGILNLKKKFFLKIFKRFLARKKTKT